MESILLHIPAVMSVFAWAFFSFWSAIPAGLAMNINPILITTTVTLSYASGIALVLLVGAPLRNRIRKRVFIGEESGVGTNSMVIAIQRAWARFGLVGLSLLAPITVGSQIGTVIGLSLGARPIPLFVLMTMGAALWATGLTLATTAGLVTITSIL